MEELVERSRFEVIVKSYGSIFSADLDADSTDLDDVVAAIHGLLVSATYNSRGVLEAFLRYAEERLGVENKS